MLLYAAAQGMKYAGIDRIAHQQDRVTLLQTIQSQPDGKQIQPGIDNPVTSILADPLPVTLIIQPCLTGDQAPSPSTQMSQCADQQRRQHQPEHSGCWQH